MSGIKDQKNLEELRRRLYDRETIFNDVQTKPSLPETDIDIRRGWVDARPLDQSPKPTMPESTTPIASVADSSAPNLSEGTVIDKPTSKRRYRLIAILGSLIIFVVVAVASSIYLFLGSNQISATNIGIALSAPFSVSAGEKIPLQVSITNQNPVTIESATLIFNYPPGTRAGDEQGKEIYEERKEIDPITPGETRNISMDVILFGEENEEKEIKASIEYRVIGSNGLFYKDAEPVKVKINSSPLVLRIEALEKVSSGQDYEIKLQVKSNASSIQKNILVSATYPNSFAFVSSDPAPVYGQNSWLIDEIAPEANETIVIKGRVNGLADEKGDIPFSVGSPRSDNQFLMGSLLTKATMRYTIERPFIDVVVGVNGDTDGNVVLPSGDEAEVIVSVKNTLDETIYDMMVEIEPKGNQIRDGHLQVEDDGLYNDVSKKIKYEVSGRSDLAQVLPGETREFKFSVEPDAKQSTGSFNISTNVSARRVGETRATESLLGTKKTEVKYSSVVKLGSQIGHDNGAFTDRGPVPPEVGEETTYTVSLVVEAGANDLNETLLTTTLPQHVTWLDEYLGNGTVEYNPVNKQLRWNVGNITANKREELQLQLGLLPSVTQVGQTLIVIGTQEVRTKDRFTGASLEATRPALSSEISTEAGFEKDNGIVQD